MDLEASQFRGGGCSAREGIGRQCSQFAVGTGCDSSRPEARGQWRAGARAGALWRPADGGQRLRG
eukprot:11209494-Lingulodinium_polyedra.AAC.1